MPVGPQGVEGEGVERCRLGRGARSPTKWASRAIATKDQKAAHPHILLLFDAIVLNTGGADDYIIKKTSFKLDLDSIKHGCAAKS